MLFIVLIFFMSWPQERLSAADAADRRSVLLIMVDDLNDWIGPLGGHPQARTPNLDALASRGLTFTNAHCAAPSCQPSRTALFTGVAPHRSGVYTNGQEWDSRQMPMPITLMQAHREQGWTSIGCGKLTHRLRGSGKVGRDWDAFKGAAYAKDPGPKKDRVRLGAPVEPGRRFQDQLMVDYAIDQLAKHPGDKPLFLGVGIYRPHMPWNAPVRWFEQQDAIGAVQLPKISSDDRDDLPDPGNWLIDRVPYHADIVEAGTWEANVRAYLSCIAFADHQIGRLLAAWDASAHAENGVIVLVGDHGWSLGEKEHWRKFTLWERTTKTPMFWVVPGVTEAGRRCQAPASLLDIYPTLAGLGAVTVEHQLDGKDLAPLLADPEAAWDRPALTTYGLGHHALRDQEWRYIRYRDGSEELYRTAHDPGEHRNLATAENRAAHAATIERLAAWLPAENAPNAPFFRQREHESGASYFVPKQ